MEDWCRETDTECREGQDNGTRKQTRKYGTAEGRKKRVTTIFCSEERNGGGMTAGKPFARAAGKFFRQQRNGRGPGIREPARQGMVRAACGSEADPVTRMRKE